MSNPSKRKGTKHESAVRDYLVSQNITAARVAPNGALDLGDLHVGDTVVECKDTLSWAVAESMDEALREAINAGKPNAVVIRKRRNAHVSRSYVVMELEQWARLLQGPAEADKALITLGKQLQSVVRREIRAQMSVGA